MKIADPYEQLEYQLECSRLSVRRRIADTKLQARSLCTVAADSAGDAVHETVREFKDAVSLERQVEKHPWGAVGLAVSAGATAGYLIGPPAQLVPEQQAQKRTKSATPQSAPEQQFADHRMLRSLLQSGLMELGSILIAKGISAVTAAIQRKSAPPKPEYRDSHHDSGDIIFSNR